MKWTVKLERIDEAGNLQSTIVGYVERPELTSEADLGLTHDDGKGCGANFVDERNETAR